MAEQDTLDLAQKDNPKFTTTLALALAKQGDPIIIATLMNRLLEPQGMTAKVSKKGTCLHITLEANQVPDQQKMVEFTRQGILKLQPKPITSVKVFGKQINENVPQWQEEIRLAHGDEPIKPVTKESISNNISQEADTLSNARVLSQEAEQPKPTSKSKMVAQKVDRPESTQMARQRMSNSLMSSNDFAPSGYSLAILTTVLFSLGIIWYSFSKLTNPNATPGLELQNSAPLNQTLPTTDTHLSIIDFDWKIEELSRNLVGSVRNSSGQNYGYVLIKFNLYDKSGKPVGNTMAIVERLEPYQTKTFEAIVVEDRAATAKLKEIAGF